MSAKAKTPKYSGWTELCTRFPQLRIYTGPTPAEAFIADVREAHGDRAVLDTATAGDPVRLARAILEGRTSDEGDQ
jgi:hypothetical protein